MVGDVIDAGCALNGEGGRPFVRAPVNLSPDALTTPRGHDDDGATDNACWFLCNICTRRNIAE